MRKILVLISIVSCVIILAACTQAEQAPVTPTEPVAAETQSIAHRGTCDRNTTEIPIDLR